MKISIRDVPYDQFKQFFIDFNMWQYSFKEHSPTTASQLRTYSIGNIQLNNVLITRVSDRPGTMLMKHNDEYVPATVDVEIEWVTK